MTESAGPQHAGAPRYRLQELPDGTVRQFSPLTATVVWTVPRRSHRPLPGASGPVRPLSTDDLVHRCAFCAGRYLDTPPEKARLLGPDGGQPAGSPGRILRHLPAAQLQASVA